MTLDLPSTGALLHVCTAIESGTCFDGFFLDDRCTNGAFCLRPAGDAPGLCLTPEEEARFCAGPHARAFSCASYGTKDAGAFPDGVIP
jgi:hypothetical protein